MSVQLFEIKEEKKEKNYTKFVITPLRGVMEIHWEML